MHVINSVQISAQNTHTVHTVCTPCTHHVHRQINHLNQIRAGLFPTFPKQRVFLMYILMWETCIGACTIHVSYYVTEHGKTIRILHDFIGRCSRACGRLNRVLSWRSKQWSRLGDDEIVWWCWILNKNQVDREVVWKLSHNRQQGWKITLTSVHPGIPQRW